MVKGAMLPLEFFIEMKKKLKDLPMTILGLFFFFILPAGALKAQQYNSVPLDHGAYEIIENATLRGIIRPPPSAKPWQEAAVRELLQEILNADPGLRSPAERDIVSALLKDFERKPGLDLQRGASYLHQPLKGDSHYSLDMGLSWESRFNLTGTGDIGTVNMGTFYLGGDIGRYLSYDFNVRGGILKIDRNLRGMRKNPPYYDPAKDAGDHTFLVNIPDETNVQPDSPMFSLPAYFPYTFTKPWEAAVFMPKSLDSYGEWPESFAFGYEILSELGTALADGRLRFRFGRLRRDWGPGENGASLVLNSQARPFMALEGTALPADWMYFSFLTGALEYQKIHDQWNDAASFQNLFSLAMLEFNGKDYLHFDFGSATVWPKRFDLGYLFPVNSNFFYQNNIGDFDNLALFANLEGRWPGLGKLWVSLFVDEINLTKDDFFHLDREMYAFQGGVKVLLPGLPFASLSLRYTKIEPYCYTHEYTLTPWNSALIDTSYGNNGEPLGYYLPPNSDELVLRLESAFLPETKAYLQYQLIRHGVEYGYGRVDGSSLGDKIVKNNNSPKYFLQDGVYQWDNVIKAGGSYSLRGLKIPAVFYGELGLVITRFSKAAVSYPVPDPEAGDPGRGKGDYHFFSDDIYKAGTSVIISLGFAIFP
jgi:hypothetical protein